MIVTITLNPALDKSTQINQLVAEKKMRCTSLQVGAGGGGINVSKVIKEIGGETIAIFPAGGSNGKELQQLLDNEEIAYKAIPIAGDTRQSLAVEETTTNAQYRFVFPGPELSPTELENVFDEIARIQPKPLFIVFSGSLPPNVSVDFIKRLAACCREMGAKFIADTSGIPLQAALQEGVYLLKPNLSELCFLSGIAYLEADEIEPAAKAIIDQGNCEVIVVSMGPAGALLLSKDICKRIPAPVIKKQSTVGAGDSMVAGITYMLSQNKTLLEAAQFGVACGTAASIHTGSKLCQKKEVLRIFDWIKLNTP